MCRGNYRQRSRWTDRPTTRAMDLQMGCLWNVFEMSVRYIVWNVFNVSLNCLWNGFVTSLECLWNINVMYLRCLWTFFDMLWIYWKRLWNVCDMSLNCNLNVFRMSLCLWNDSETYLIWRWNVFDIISLSFAMSVKRIWKDDLRLGPSSNNPHVHYPHWRDTTTHRRMLYLQR